LALNYIQRIKKNIYDSDKNYIFLAKTGGLGYLSFKVKIDKQLPRK